MGLALSGGSVRGIAHIGVIKALSEAGISPSIITGTSAGSLIGAALASGKDWQQIAAMACDVFWPGLLRRRGLEQYCRKHLPETFGGLCHPFAAVATAMPSKQPVTISSGDLVSAVSASCAMRVIRRPVLREGRRLKDGGIACVLPVLAGIEMGAEIVIASDVWEVSAALRRFGVHPDHRHSRRFYPEHYLAAVRRTFLLIQPDIPRHGYVPGPKAVQRLIAAGERAAKAVLAYSRLSFGSAD